MAPVVTLRPGEIWLTDMFVLPDCRHQSLNYHFGTFTIRYMAALGYMGLLGSIATSNLPSLRSAARRGTQTVCRIAATRRLLYRRVRVSDTIPEVTQQRLTSSAVA